MMDELHATIFVRALFPLLQENEGVAVHFEGKGYLVCKTANPELDGDNEVRVRLIEDDDMLNYPDLQLMWLHDEPVGNA